MRAFLVLLLLFANFGPAAGWAQYVCFHQENNGTNTIVIPAGETWQLISYAAYTGDPGNNSIQIFTTTNQNSSAAWPYLYYDYGNIIAAKQYSSPGFILPGPMYVKIGANFPNYHFVFKKMAVGTDKPVSATSVAIPTSSAGDIEIKVEQSADMLTWTECLPGTYNPSALKRFFRLRALEK